MGYIGLINGLIVLIKKKSNVSGVGVRKRKKKRKEKGGGGGPFSCLTVIQYQLLISYHYPASKHYKHRSGYCIYTHTHNLTLVAEKVHSQQFLPAGKAQAISAPLPDCLIILPPPPWIQRA